MKNTRFPARFLAFFLAVCMAASLTSLPALAEDVLPTVENITVLDGGNEVKVRIEDATATISFEEGQGFANGLEVPVTQDDSGAVTVNASVVQNGSNDAVLAEGNSTVSISGSVTGSTGNSVNADDTSTINVGGSVTNTEGTGVYADSHSIVNVGTEASPGNVSGGNIGVNAQESSVTVTGAVSGTNTGVIANDRSTVNAGSVTSENGTGVNAAMTSEVNVTGAVSGSDAGVIANNSKVNADSVTSDGIGVNATSKAEVNVTGEVNAGDTGIVAENAAVNAGSVGSADNPVGGRGVEASAIGEGSTTTVNVGTGTGDSFQGGDIYATGTGVDASASNSGQTEVNAGNVSASGDESRGVSASAEGGNATVNADAVSVTGGWAVGAEAEAEGGTATIKADSISASGEGSTGISVSVSDGGTATVTVDGDVEAATGIDITLSPLSPAVEEVAIGEVTECTGAVSGQDNAASEQAENVSQTTVTVDGDVNATKTGPSVVESSDFSSDSGPHIGETEKVDVVITGTLSAGEKAVVVDEHVTEDNLSLTVWKIEVAGKAPTENDTLVQPAGGDNGNEAGTSGTVENAYNTGAVSTSESSTSVAADTSIAAEPSAGESKTFTDASIQYIIRVDTNVHNSDGTNAGTLSAKQDAALEKGLATGTAGGETYQYAHENDKVYLKIDVTDDSFEVDKAYGDEGVELELIQDEGSGSYYVVVPKGGGVYLSVTLKDKSQDNNENENNNQNNQNQNQEQNNQNQNQEQNNQNQQQNQNQEQNNNPIPANAEKVENLIKVSVVSDSGGSNGNGNGVWTYSPNTTDDNLLVQGTVDGETVIKKVDDVVDPLPVDNEFTALLDISDVIFQNSFNIENGEMLDSGIVNFKEAYDNSDEKLIAVPLKNDDYWKNNTYTVVYSDGTVVHAVCTNAGVLWIPFPHDAKGLAFVVLKGTVESSQLVKQTILAAETPDSGAGSVTLQFDANQVAGPIVDGIHNEVHVQNTGWTGRARDGEFAGTTGQSRRLEAVRVSLTGDALMDSYSVWYRVHAQTYGWLGWAHDGEPAGTAGLAKRAEAIDVQVLPQGQVPRGYDATQRAPAAQTGGTTGAFSAAGGSAAGTGYVDAAAFKSASEAAQNALNAQQSAANANAAGTTTEATSAAGGPAADPDIIRDNDALLAAAIKSALEDARNARQTNNANAAGTTTEAASAAGGDAADTDSLVAAALEDARNAQQSAANANAAGTTTEATSAANAYAPDHSGHRITVDLSGAFGD